MAKDYFQDIVPPTGSPRPSQPVRPEYVEEEHIEPTPVPINSETPVEPADRSIRNVSINRTTPRRIGELREPSNLGPTRRSRAGSRWLLWSAAALAVVILGALMLVALRPTRVTIVPRTHTITFSEQQFSAVPTSGTAAGTLSYAVETLELEDSEVVPSDGTVYAEDKATGTITVYNNYQTTPLRLIRNTRFTSSSGHVFRAPADIVVPAKQGNTPGKIDITVVADQPGEQYNVAPGRFTLPGLQNTPAMYADVYAESSTAFTGGFVGEKPGVAAGALEAAIASVRARLESKARASMPASEGTISFAELAFVTYESMPNTTEASGNVRIHQKARVQIPVFQLPDFIAAIGRTAIGDTDPTTVTLLSRDALAAASVVTSPQLGTDALQFTLSGSTKLVWNVPSSEVQQALAGKDEAAFESVIATFSSVQEARAHIQPFWKNTFPSEPSDIKIKVEAPENAK